MPLAWGCGPACSSLTPTLTMDDGHIQAGTVSGSGGNAGGAEVRVGSLTLTGGAQIDTNTRGSGRGGDLTVSATDAIAIHGDITVLCSVIPLEAAIRVECLSQLPH